MDIKEESIRVRDTLIDIINDDIDLGQESGVWESVLSIAGGGYPVFVTAEDLKAQLNGILLYLLELERYEIADQLVTNHKNRM